MQVPSFQNYASRAKAEHIESISQHQVPWSTEMATELRNCTRSILRGKGPSKQSLPIELDRVLARGPWSEPVVTGGPVGVSDMLTLGTFFMTREIETAWASLTHIRLDHNKREVTWNLPVSKTDTRALGTYRTWGCLCDAHGGFGCPFHSAVRQNERLVRLAQALGVSATDLPLFPDNEGRHVSKVAMVSTINWCVKAAGFPTTDSMGRPLYGGHSMRTGGASLLSRLGLDSARIEAMARWNSPMLLHYARTAPLRAITSEFRCRAASSSSSNTTVEPSLISNLQTAISDLKTRLDAVLEADARWEQRLSILESANAPTQFVQNCTSGVWHKTMEHGTGIPSATVCGWCYVGSVVTVIASLPADVDHKLVCGKCLPKTRTRLRGEAGCTLSPLLAC